MVNIQIKGIDELIKKLGMFKASEILEPTMRWALDRLWRQIVPYPAKPIGSTYRRTMMLGKTWNKKVDQTSTRLVGSLGVDLGIVPYARYVQDRDRQAWMHKGRWKTIQDVAEKETGTIRRQFEIEIERSLR